MQDKTFTIIDGYGFLFRAYYALPRFVNQHDIPIGGVYGFLNMLLKYINESDYLVIALDSGKKNFRHNLFPAYKANRSTIPDALIPQFTLLREAVHAFDIKYEEMEGYEADDIIATLALHFSKQDYLKVIVVSSDKDLFQLLKDNILIFDPIKNMFIDENILMNKFGVMSNKLLDLFAMAGDAADNILGIPGIGIKTANKLLNEFGSLNEIINNIHNIKQTRIRDIFKQHKEQAIIARALLSLNDQVKFQHDIQNYRINITNIEKIVSFLKKHSLHSLIKKVQKLLPKTQLIEHKISYYDSQELEKFLAHCRYEGKIAIYYNDQYKIFNLSYNEENILHIEQNQIYQTLDAINTILLSSEVMKIIYNIKELSIIIPTIEQTMCSSIEDIMIMSYSLDTGLHDHSISNIIAHNFDTKISLYSSKTLITIYKKLIQRLFQEKLFSIYECCDKPLIRVILSMERIGICLDAKKISKLSEKLSNTLVVLQNEIYALAGQEFNIASPKQLSDILLNKMQIYKRRHLKISNFYSTNSHILQQLVIDGEEIASKILNWRHYNKIRSTYTDSLINLINPTDGRIHTTFSTTITGRISSLNPNLQNIPIRSQEGMLIRESFIANTGYQIISADYSQIELRILAHIADIKLFKDAFTHEQDIHNITARQVFAIPQDIKVDNITRNKAKSINFGIIYGINSFGLSQKLQITVQEASKYINDFFECYPEIKLYVEQVISFARRHGYVETLFGRKCFIKEINNTRLDRRKYAERLAINASIQGTASDIIKRAMIQLFDLLQEGSDIILQIHDELLFEVENERVRETVQLIKAVMENTTEISVPLKVKVQVGSTWNFQSN
ncbi:DNA polymerase I [Wolbachia endosymbiont of Howardula sp.]|uniref:DNA polymerase I n=1 Tax=Wolbachia endosymbiont of Howardula sp. TaxID=2916816 RepID=UPI00217E6010|nr:DNA polymerase I [Wolbachia endosymbiont of Howardula sp.]UWI83083.1 DNA polymerase I [Wolbachia endosymbiont of Howardula sp.]